MDVSSLIEQLHALVPDAGLVPGSATDTPTIVVPAAHIVEVCRAVRDHLGFAFLSDLTCTDVHPREPRFTVIYQVVNLDAPARVRFEVRVPGAEPHVDTVSGVFTNANWAEREVFDLFGVVFAGHPDLRRILLTDDWEGHPLRKDYPVQVNVPVKTHDAIQVTEAEFVANIQRQRTRLSPTRS